MKRKLLVINLIFLLLLIPSCAQQSQQQKNQAVGGVESSINGMGDIERIKVISDGANIRNGCSANNPVIEKAQKNDTYDVVNKVADWYAVKTPDNQIGFIPSGQSKPIVKEEKNPEVTPSNTVTTPQATTSPKTPTTQANSGSLTSDEQQLLNLVNQARSQNNVPALKIDMQLTNVARVKSQDMIDNNYFSHNSPKYGSPFDMMKSFGTKYVQAGENIAGNQNVQNAHNALMNSPGHRKNILDPNFTHIGIGIKNGGPYGNMFTQMFISKPQ